MSLSDDAYGLLRCCRDWLEGNNQWEEYYAACIEGEIPRDEEKMHTDRLLEEVTRPQCQRAVKMGFMPSTVQDIMSSGGRGNEHQVLAELEAWVAETYDLEAPF